MNRLLFLKTSHDNESSFQLLKQQIGLSLVCRKRLCPSQMPQVVQESECKFAGMMPDGRENYSMANLEEAILCESFRFSFTKEFLLRLK